MPEFGLPAARSNSPIKKALAAWAAENSALAKEQHWPTAEAVAVALVAACRELDDRPHSAEQELFRSLTSHTGKDGARKWAYYALCDVLATTQRAAIAKVLGAKNPARIASAWDKQRFMPERAKYSHPPYWYQGAIDAAAAALQRLMGD